MKQLGLALGDRKHRDLDPSYTDPLTAPQKMEAALNAKANMPQLLRTTP